MTLIPCHAPSCLPVVDHFECIKIALCIIFMSCAFGKDASLKNVRETHKVAKTFEHLLEHLLFFQYFNSINKHDGIKMLKTKQMCVLWLPNGVSEHFMRYH